MRKLVYLTSARLDLADIAHYLINETKSRRTGTHFAGQLRRRCRELTSLPGTMGRARPELGPDIRSIAYKSYVILFRYRGENFEVVNIIEGHRDLPILFGRDPH